MNRRTTKYVIVLAVSIVNYGGVQIDTFAQDVVLEEVIVTARKVEENLQVTPVAVTAFGSENIEDLSAFNVADLVNYVPNMPRTAPPTAGSDGYYFIRGVGQSDPVAAVDPGVGTYLDGVYLGRVQGASFDTMDIKQIEVLRGPQGTLFGRNTMGGAIIVTTSDPGDTFGFTAKVTGGSRNRFDGQLSVDVPVTDRFKLKLSGLSRNQNGPGKRADGVTFGDIKTTAGRVKALWEPMENLTVRLSADFTDGDGTPSHTVLFDYSPPPTTPLAVLLPPAGLLQALIPGQSTGVERWDNNSSIDPDNELNVWGVSANIDWDIDNIHLKSITSYREMKSFHRNDFDGSPFSIYDGFWSDDQNQFSQELQFNGKLINDRLNWLLGFYYFNEAVTHNGQTCLGTNNGLPPADPNFGFVALDQRCIRNNRLYDLDIESWATFAHISYRVTDRITAIAGVRYTYEEKIYDYDLFIDNTDGVFTFIPKFPPGSIVPTLSAKNPSLGISNIASDSWTSVTPKFGVDFQATDDILVYYSYAEGFKSGGFNGRPRSGSGGVFFPLKSFEPEELTTNEFGAKSEWFGKRLRLNVAAFFSTYKNIQFLANDPETGLFDQSNAAEASVDGFEIELMARPLSRLNFNAAVGYTDAKYTKLTALTIKSGLDFDDPLLMAPKWNFNFGAQYAFLLDSLGTFTIRGDYTYQSSVCYQAACNPFDIQDGVGLVNFRGTYTNPSERITISVFGLNVTDEEYVNNAQDVSRGLGVSFGQLGNPAEWGIEVAYKYGY